MYKYTISALLVSILSGCSLFTPPLNQPVIEEKLNAQWLRPGKVGTLSLTPERRVVLVNFTNSRFCAEAPTESGIDATQLRRLTASANKKGELEAAIDALSASSHSNTVLNRRTQGVQLYLASAYFACQMFMNNAITNKELLEIHFDLLQKIPDMIHKEIDQMYVYATNEQESKKVDLEKLMELINSINVSKPDSKDNGNSKAGGSATGSKNQ